ncbi:MAG: hypothetical protein MJB14_04075 [Spirochaetes bacterium]|nr:hypothetical protein [Spirochaetota bacterium]
MHKPFDFCQKCKKNLYHTRREAQDVKQFRENEERNLQLTIYHCPHQKGYHLSEKI